ncbi:hypothetical protein IX27_00320 [Streptomyces sp. JS01]|uniref:hypothetical protein n=1 Tax=Streptomyces sp. JS01 TaxID=1525753 RepID=UPI0004FFFBF1|nr:hypothetical protein [Streptomyces sp. JS01]KFK91511.1 hypothetical protein IX27_00320 [Streptomyces sp. JS01]
MNTVTALMLGLEAGAAIGLVAFATGTWSAERTAGRADRAAARQALRLAAADSFYIQFLTYRLGRRRAVDVPLRFEKAHAGRTWGDA